MEAGNSEELRGSPLLKAPDRINLEAYSDSDSDLDDSPMAQSNSYSKNEMEVNHIFMPTKNINTYSNSALKLPEPLFPGSSGSAS